MELTEQYGLFSKSQHQVCLKGIVFMVRFILAEAKEAAA